MDLPNSSANLCIRKPLWDVMRGIVAKPAYFCPRSDRDLEALQAVFELLNSVERRRSDDGRATAILPLPSDPRQLHWLDVILYLGSKRRVRASALRARRRVREHLPTPPLAQALYDRFIRLRWHDWCGESRFVRVRLCNLGYVAGNVPAADPEGCLHHLDAHIRVGRQQGWLTAHMEVQLAAERDQGLL